MNRLMQKLNKQPFYVNLPIAALILAATWCIPYFAAEIVSTMPHQTVKAAIWLRS